MTQTPETTTLRDLMTNALETGMTLQREALDGARDAARTGIALQRATLRGTRAGVHRFMTTAVPRDGIAQTAAAMANAVPGTPEATEAFTRTTTEAMRTAFTMPVESADRMASLVLEPYDRMLDMMEAQVEGTTRAWTTTMQAAAEVNRNLAVTLVDTWTSAFAFPTTQPRTTPNA